MIDAMKQALQALEQCVCDEQFRDKDLEARARAALRTAIEAAERQVPVAWLNPAWPQYCGILSPVTTYETVGWKPLYAHPTTITDEMVERAVRATHPVIGTYTKENQQYFRQLARAALEAALGVKHAE